MRRNSIASSWMTDYRVTITIAALLGIGFFLAVSALTFRVGFPLDDAWIHLTYARNFALHGEWAFRLGEGSAGSTSPLWTGLVSIGYWLHLSPYVWTFLLGWLVLSAMAIRAEQIASKLVLTYRARIPWVGLFIALAWHLTWSATSGMETLLHGFIILVVLGMLMEGSHLYLALGLLSGLSVWVRPDGLTLLGPILFVAYFQNRTFRSRGLAFGKVLIGFSTLFVFYLLFNLALSGSPMPNTFYAKQAEYSEYLASISFSERLLNYLSPLIASPFILLVPGFFIGLTRIFRDRNLGAIASFLWLIGYIGIYFLRLPAYQHGRYIIPAFPILYLFGLLGLVWYVSSPNVSRRISFLWHALVIVLTLMFQWAGARQNAQDVLFVETQMVNTAVWINRNLPPDAILGIHDVGAVGYFTRNPILDLAGLVTPDVIPFIRDETLLGEYLRSENAQYLVTFPDWYPQLVAGRTPLFRAENDLYPYNDTMSIFRWND